MVGGNKTVGLDQKGRIGIVAFDFGFCWGIPILFMALRKLHDVFRFGRATDLPKQTTLYRITDTTLCSTLAASQRLMFQFPA